ncbi:MAG: hypothetical protein E7054_08945 [Lentisphaerae bacterium]|nr:hypothetical protein [Lentisphaerota bacterium]
MGAFFTADFLAGAFLAAFLAGAFFAGALVSGALVSGALVSGALVSGALVSGASPVMQQPETPTIAASIIENKLRCFIFYPFFSGLRNIFYSKLDDDIKLAHNRVIVK